MSNQKGHLYARNHSFHVRYYVHENGVRKQRSHRLCPNGEAPETVAALLEEFMLRINTSNVFNDEQPGHNCPICGNRCKRTITQKFAPQA